jgi:hypothetical protein
MLLVIVIVIVIVLLLLVLLFLIHLLVFDSRDRSLPSHPLIGTVESRYPRHERTIHSATSSLAVQQGHPAFEFVDDLAVLVNRGRLGARTVRIV